MLVVSPILRLRPWTDPYLLTWTAKMAFHMVVPAIRIELPILAILTQLLHWMDLKPSPPSLGKVLPLPAPLRKVRQSDLSCLLGGRHTRKEHGLIVCSMISEKIFRCFLLRPPQQRLK